ncbi:hypothetical protein O1L44_09595 [Streptomyces noursei]|nr:hypothetical protein [Streptomyces noursei]
MLRALPPAEREALFAHERAHLAGRHHLFLLAAELAAVCHPLLRELRSPLAYALERWADESAAARVGDRQVTARAIGRAALAARTHAAAPRPAPRRPPRPARSPPGRRPAGLRPRGGPPARPVPAGWPPADSRRPAGLRRLLRGGRGGRRGRSPPDRGDGPGEQPGR